MHEYIHTCIQCYTIKNSNTPHARAHTQHVMYYNLLEPLDMGVMAREEVLDANIAVGLISGPNVV